jgi:hypothetical protein
MLPRPLNGLPYSLKSEPVGKPTAEDWRLLRLKLATMRLRDAITETEEHSDALHGKGKDCWLDEI